MNKKVELFATTLGLKLKETFSLIGKGYDKTQKYRFTKKELQTYNEETKKWEKAADKIFADIVYQKAKVVYLENGNHSYVDENNKETDPRQDTWNTQRLKDGYSDYDTWNIDRWFLTTTPKMLRDIKGIGAPADLTQEEWDEILETIASEFEQANSWNLEDKEKEKHLKKGFKLFEKYFNDLWW